ncbi:MAG: ABC-type transport auxiliary lipoprotein family protein [Sulfurospirillaceae bacterium]|nr:ABC-type transport auxiliary lipoprotein family protein [Sulfurospirillaceae bacterium]
MSKVLASVLILIFISGCSLKEMSQPITTYSITTSDTVQNQQKGQDILKISRFKSPAFLQSRRIWYKYPTSITNSYLYSQWNENFVSMIEQNVADNLSKSGLFKGVFTQYSRITPDLLLEGNVVNAVQNISSVSFDIQLYLVDSKTSKLISTKDFSYTQKCDTIDAKGAVSAYTKIVKKLNKDVILWLKTLVKVN